MNILTRYGDEQSQQQLNAKRVILNDILDAIGLDGKGRDKTSGSCFWSLTPHLTPL
jgi:hypothetical protein